MKNYSLTKEEFKLNYRAKGERSSILSYQSFRYDIQVRFRDTDGLGHINNAVYHSYIEMCRTHWLDEALDCGIFTRGEKIPLILARTEMDFLRQAYLHDALSLRCYLSHIGQKSFHQEYELSNGVHTIARAKAVLVWFDFASQSSVVIPASVRSKMEAYLAKPLP